MKISVFGVMAGNFIETPLRQNNPQNTTSSYLARPGPPNGMPTVNWTVLFGLVNAVGIFFYPDVV